MTESTSKPARSISSGPIDSPPQHCTQAGTERRARITTARSTERCPPPVRGPYLASTDTTASLACHGRQASAEHGGETERYGTRKEGQTVRGGGGVSPHTQGTGVTTAPAPPDGFARMVSRTESRRSRPCPAVARVSQANKSYRWPQSVKRLRFAYAAGRSNAPRTRKTPPCPRRGEVRVGRREARAWEVGL
jgi:hypothetical protein